MIGNVDRPRGVSAVEALNTRLGTTCFLHLLPVKDMDKAKGKDSSPSSHIRAGVGSQPNSPSRTGHLSKFRLDVSTNRHRIMGAEFM